MPDDQGNRPTGRYYTIAVDLTDGALDDGDLDSLDVTQICESQKTPFAPGGLDPEGFEGFPKWSVRPLIANLWAMQGGMRAKTTGVDMAHLVR